MQGHKRFAQVMFVLLVFSSLLLAGESILIVNVLGQINITRENDAPDLTINKQHIQLTTTSNSTDLKLYQKVIPEHQGLVELWYPSNWTLVENEGYWTIAELFSPLLGQNDTFKEAMRIGVEPITNFLTSNEGLVGYVNATIERYNTTSFNFELIDSHIKPTGKSPSYDIVYEVQYGYDQRKLKGAQFGYLIGDDVYFLDFLSENPVQYDEYENIVNDIFSSFKAERFLPYYNIELGVYLQYPSNFNKSDSDSSIFEDFLNEENSEIEFESDVGNFTVRKYPIGGSDQSLSYTEDSIIRNIENGNISSIERSDTNSSTILTRQILANFTDEGGLYKEWLLGMSNGNSYEIEFQFPRKYYDYFQLVKTKMLNSFVTFELYPYVSRNFDIFVEYPSSWEKFENRSGLSSDGHSMQEINFVSPRENNETDEFQENLVISTSYSVSHSLDSKIDKHITMLNRSYSGFKLIERNHNTSCESHPGNTLLIPAEKMIYRYAERDDSKDKQALEIWVRNGENNLYQIRFVSEFDRYDTYAEIANRMICSVLLYEDQKIASRSSSKLDTFNHSPTGMSIKHPETWEIEQSNNTATGAFSFTLDDGEAAIDLYVSALNGLMLHDYVSSTAGDLAYQYEPIFEIIDSSPFTLWNENNNIQAHRLILYFMVEQTPIYQIYIFAQKDDRLYTLSYWTIINSAENHLFEFIQAVESFDLQKMSADPLQDSTDMGTGLDGIPVQGYPFDIVIHPSSHKLLVAAERIGAVHILDATTAGIIKTEKVGNMPLRIALQDGVDSAYVANCRSDSVSAIDLSTNELIATINVGKAPWDLAISSIGDVYVINYGSRSVSVIEPTTNLVTKNITLPINPAAVASNVYTNRIYVAGYEDEDISNPCLTSAGEHNGNLIIVIDAGSNEIIDTIDSDSIRLDYDEDIDFQSIAVHPATNTLYAANTLSNTLYKIDGNTNEVIGRFEAGLFYPDNVEVNPVTGKVYVSSIADGKISVIDGGSNPVLVETDGYPTSISIDPQNNKVYFNNYVANTINELNGETNKRMFGLNLTISPTGSGKIICGNRPMGMEEKEYSSNIRLIYDNDTKHTCTAYANGKQLSVESIIGIILPPIEDILNTGLIKNYEFIDWSGTVGQVSNAAVSINLSEHHDLVANFREASPILSKEYRNTIFGIILTVIIPFIVRWIYQRRKKKKAMRESAT